MCRRQTIETRTNCYSKELPEATILFLLEHTLDPSDIVYNQMETLDHGERHYGENWSLDREAYLKNLVFLSQLPRN